MTAGASGAQDPASSDLSPSGPSSTHPADPAPAGARATFALRRLERDRLWRAIAVGIVAGALSGLFGVGGGILMVPALVMAMGFDQRLAHGTSLAAVVPISISGMVSYAVAGEVDWLIALCLAVGAVGGAVIGTNLLKALPHRVLAICFAALLLATAVRMLVGSGAAGEPAPLSLLGAGALVVAGLASGILAGLLGVGGGIIMVPVMVVGFDLTAALAKGTSLVVILPTAVMGTWRNIRNGNADLSVAVVVGLAGVVSAYLAGMLSVTLPDALANGLFAALLLLVAAQMVWKLWRERGSAEAH